VAFNLSNSFIINFLVSILVINVVFASLYSGQLMPHYLAVSYPSIFILAGVVIYFTKKINKAFPLLILIIISIFLFQKNDFFSSSGYTMPEDLTLKEIGERLGLTEPRISQIKSGIIKRLRKLFEQEGYKISRDNSGHKNKSQNQELKEFRKD